MHPVPPPHIPNKGSRLSGSRRGCIWLAAVALLAVLIGLASPAQTETEQSIVVLVNDDPISVYDIEQRMRFLAVTTQASPSAALKKQATEMLIEEKLQMQEGRKLGVTPDEAEVSKILAGMAEKNNMNPENLTAALGQMGVNIKTLTDRVKAQTVWQGVVRRKFRQDIVIGDVDVDKALTDAGGSREATEKTALQLRQIKLEVSNGGDQAAVAKKLAAIETLRARLKSCANVSSLTKEIKGLTVRTLQNQLPNSLKQPVRTLVMHAKVGQMTPPTLSGSVIEAYAVCGKHTIKGDPEQRQQAERKLMEVEFGIRAEGLLRDMRHDAFIEHR